MAGRVQADIFDGITNMIPLKRARLLAPYVPAAAGQYPPELKDPEGYWNALLLYVFTPGINTTLVPKERAPKTYQDLLDPQWKGKMAWNPSSIAGAIGFVGNILTSMGEARGMDYLKALARQKVVNVEASARAILDQVIAGEYAIGLMTFNHHTVISAQKGAPSDWLKLEPVPVAFDAAGILKDAPHPERGAAADRVPDLRGRPTGIAEGRLSAGHAQRAGDEAGPASGGRRLQGDVLSSGRDLRPHSPLAQVVNELFK